MLIEQIYPVIVCAAMYPFEWWCLCYWEAVRIDMVQDIHFCAVNSKYESKLSGIIPIQESVFTIPFDATTMGIYHQFLII